MNGILLQLFQNTLVVLLAPLLLGWVTVQPFVIGQFSWLQPVFGVLGIAVCLLGYRLHRLTTSYAPPRIPFGASPA